MYILFSLLKKVISVLIIYFDMKKKINQEFYKIKLG